MTMTDRRHCEEMCSNRHNCLHCKSNSAQNDATKNPYMQLV